MANTSNESHELRVKQMLRCADHWAACAAVHKRKEVVANVLRMRTRANALKNSKYGRSMHEGARLAARRAEEEEANRLTLVERRMKEVQRTMYLSQAALRERATAEVRDQVSKSGAWRRATREVRADVAVIEELSTGGAVKVAGLPPPRVAMKKAPAVIAVSRGSRSSYSNLIGRAPEPTTLAEDEVVTSGVAAGWTIRLLQHATGARRGQTYSAFVSPDGTKRFFSRADVEAHLELTLKAEMARRARGGRAAIRPQENGSFFAPLRGRGAARGGGSAMAARQAAQRQTSRSSARSGRAVSSSARPGRREDVARLMARRGASAAAAQAKARAHHRRNRGAASASARGGGQLRAPRGAHLIRTIHRAREERSEKLAALRAQQSIEAEEAHIVDPRPPAPTLPTTQMSVPSAAVAALKLVDHGYAPRRGASVQRASAGRAQAALPVLDTGIRRSRG